MMERRKFCIVWLASASESYFQHGGGCRKMVNNGQDKHGADGFPTLPESDLHSV
jgi:hypothetical protein